MHKIIITDPVRLLNAVDFAMNNGCLDELGRSLCHLIQVCARSMTMGDGKPREDTSVTAEISYDFAPHSMGFAIWGDAPLEWQRPARARLHLNGGFIYHGPGSPGDGSAPAFSVSLDYVTGQAPKHSWSIHT